MSSQGLPTLIDGEAQSPFDHMRGSSHKQRPRVSPERWANHKPVIECLYDKFDLQKLMEKMEKDYGFFATRGQYMSQFRRWGLRMRTAAAAKPSSVAVNGPVNESLPTKPLSDLVSNRSFVSYSTITNASSDDSGYQSLIGSSSKEAAWSATDVIHEASDSDRSKFDKLFHEKHLNIGEQFQNMATDSGCSLPRRTDSFLVPNGKYVLISEEWLPSSIPSRKGSGRPSETTEAHRSLTRRAVSDQQTSAGSGIASPPANTSPRQDYKTLYMAGALPSHAASTTPTTGNLPLTAASPTSFKVPFERESTDFSEVDSCSQSDRSSFGVDIDLSSEMYRDALENFLDWVNRCCMPKLLVLFRLRPLVTPSESFFRSCTIGDSSGSNSTSSLSANTSTSKSGAKRKLTLPDGSARKGLLHDERASEIPLQKKRKVKLACHFHKRNPGKFSHGRYKTCPIGFDGLNRLKEHQGYAHKLEHYCKRCESIFKTQDEKDAHDLQDVRCERREGVTFADYLITDRQRAALAKKKPARMTDEDFWFEMWDGYFPGEQRPQSAFQDLDPTLSAFQSFAEHVDLPVIQAYDAYNPGHGLDVEELRRFWQFAIYFAVAIFASQQRSSASSSLTPPTPPTPPQPLPQQEHNAALPTMLPSYSDVDNSGYTSFHMPDSAYFDPYSAQFGGVS